ncbi:MAG: sn-glycerol-1-phosphate dehydrogenase [Clostridia bacterium]|nr:sn-glycerol-1-phosphate dehydrogenase [Clostridia bacterium]
MNINLSDYCSRRIPCSCGREHYCPISDIVIESGALNRLPDILASYSAIYLVADRNTYRACGERVYDLIRERCAGVYIFACEDALVPDEKAIRIAKEHMPKNTDLILGVGSGVINDLCKYTAWKQGLPSGIVATAPSMDGYASSGAAMIIGGMKVTYTAQPPKYIIADVDVVKNAPMDMIRSGYGDIIGKYSSLNDWELSHLVCGEYFCQEIHDLVLRTTDEIRDLAEKIAARDDHAIAQLTKALVLIGITLSLVETTRPGSGSEHHLSHFFEIVGLLRGEKHFPHGTDVAYNTILTAGMREQICRMEHPDFSEESAENREQAWQRVFASLTGEIRSLQKDAGSYERDLTPVYREKWEQILKILGKCPTADACNRMMRAVGLSFPACEQLYGKEKIRDAMLYGKDLKNRYSVLWLYYALFSGNRSAVDYSAYLTEQEDI